ncbi:MAG: ketoacyl reductase, partial [Planctomycetaceae bacterium]|nr:ketoacyl reductase [Planctomycetaceae bacterium]
MSWKRIGLLVAGAVAVGLIARRRRPPSSKYFIHKTVLITGGSRGLGLVLARKIGQAGARVIICARNAQQLEQARVDLQRRDINASAFECDVTDQVAVQKMMSQIEARWGTLDLVVNNAGWIQVGPFDSLTEDDFEVAMRTHFWGPLYVMLEVLPGMRKRGSGQIVNITSIGGKISVPHLLAYNSSKFALVGLSQGIAAEVAQDGVQVTTVCPGLMRTGSPRNAVFKGDHRAEYAWFSIADSIPGLSMEAER